MGYKLALEIDGLGSKSLSITEFNELYIHFGLLKAPFNLASSFSISKQEIDDGAHTHTKVLYFVSESTDYAGKELLNVDVYPIIVKFDIGMNEVSVSKIYVGSNLMMFSPNVDGTSRITNFNDVIVERDSDKVQIQMIKEQMLTKDFFTTKVYYR